MPNVRDPQSIGPIISYFKPLNELIRVFKLTRKGLEYEFVVISLCDGQCWKVFLGLLESELDHDLAGHWWHGHWFERDTKGLTGDNPTSLAVQPLQAYILLLTEAFLKGNIDIEGWAPSGRENDWLSDLQGVFTPVSVSSNWTEKPLLLKLLEYFERAAAGTASEPSFFLSQIALRAEPHGCALYPQSGGFGGAHADSSEAPRSVVRSGKKLAVRRPVDSDGDSSPSPTPKKLKGYSSPRKPKRALKEMSQSTMGDDSIPSSEPDLIQYPNSDHLDKTIGYRGPSPSSDPVWPEDPPSTSPVKPTVKAPVFSSKTNVKPATSSGARNAKDSAPTGPIKMVDPLAHKKKRGTPGVVEFSDKV
ncbi:uncharacterized protein BXZ73DRAFT_75560 [Epithele typhae]|uniref:uncharacterized protein n=1 Tax=Epithele typhae TaxID=378194 RepID=UPI00200777CB|nr:uncharacterized protein BXZ73DRAFT_75560 [Epithele typhae]KAH9940468.1 hypothetical protein BXZ73DRAFT_75560 [Epithele typhae]